LVLHQVSDVQRFRTHVVLPLMVLLQVSDMLPDLLCFLSW
jgi:hypothetical protein